MSDSSLRILRGDTRAVHLRELMSPLPADIRVWMNRNTLVLKSDGDSQVGLLQVGDKLCYLKYYIAKSPWQSFLFSSSYGRGIKSFDAARTLAMSSLSVPESFACLLAPGGMLLLTQGVAGGRDLKSLWQGRELSTAERENLAHEAGTVLARLHRAGFSHGDFKWSNLLWSEDRFYLVDLEAVCKSRITGRKPARDIARFTLNAEDMAMPPNFFEVFLSAYLECSGLSRPEVLKRVLPVLRALRSRHIRKYGQRGHRLLED